MVSCCASLIPALCLTLCGPPAPAAPFTRHPLANIAPSGSKLGKMDYRASGASTAESVVPLPWAWCIIKTSWRRKCIYGYLRIEGHMSMIICPNCGHQNRAGPEYHYTLEGIP